jgi:5-methylcytosine-specific restriction endonuclease McrA
MEYDAEYASRHRAQERARRFRITAKQARSIEDKKTILKGRCPDCGRKVKPDDWHTDHYIPRALGGPDSIDNFRPICSECNSKRKRALMPNAEYLAERESGQLAIVCMV